VIDAGRIAIEGVAFGNDSFVCVLVSVECGRFGQEKRLAAASLLVYRNLHGEIFFSIPLLSEYQVPRPNLPNLLRCDGGEVTCYVGSLLWILVAALDSFRDRREPTGGS
jgi:hypothetical protein